ncbi:MAG: GNAT family N-acetyltransferase [Bacteroidia bacterium]
MKVFVETERLYMREMVQEDAAAFFEMDSDPQVHIYLGNNPIKTIEESRDIIEFVRKQYEENGIGRWSLIEKESGNYIGWGGLKLLKELTNGHINILDVGYRLNKKYWNQGYASESAQASLKYGFEVLKAQAIYASAHHENKASRAVLEKSGLVKNGQYKWEGIPCDWFEISREKWLELYFPSSHHIKIY